MSRKKVCYSHVEDHEGVAAGKGVHHSNYTTLRMLLISSPKIIIVSSFFLSSLFEASAVNLSAFDQEINKKATTVNHHNRHRRKMVYDDASVSNYQIQGQYNFFDAMALSYHENINELTKERSAGTNMRIKQKKNSFRKLDEEDGLLLATRTFSECIEQTLSPDECQSLIQTQIEDAGGHEVGEVNVKIQTPRTPEQFAESYWMVEVPVNLYAKMTCDRNDGKTFYPFKWRDGVTGNSLNVEDQDCYGLSAGECCLKIRDYGKQLTTTGYDDNKQCLSCFVHQEPLEPVLNEETGETDYLECKNSDLGDCVQEQLTGAQVDVLDLQTVRRIETAITSLESFQKDPTCDSFDQLVEDLYNAAVVIPPLSIKIGRLACMVCHGVHDLQLEDNVVTFELAEILMTMKKHSPPAKQISSKENCIIIYTNSDGEIARDPTLGGKRSNMIGKRDTSPYVPPASTAPTTAPVGRDDSRRDCRIDSDCDDDEWCKPIGNRRYCEKNRCITDPPEDCRGENQICEPSPYESDNYYTCSEIDCHIDPSICKENEFCNMEFVDSLETYTCEAYKELGESCGFSYYGYGDNSIIDGVCDPDLYFCLDPFACTYTRNRPAIIIETNECVAYGEGSCADENGQLTQSNCKSDEYCDRVDERCKPKPSFGECCKPALNNCGYGSDLGTLICAPKNIFTLYYGYVSNIFVCQKVCETDDDCGSTEWCAPVDEQEDKPPNYPGKFCKEYRPLGEYCHIILPGLIMPNVHTEERCDPSHSYCYNRIHCYTYEAYYYESQCRSYGNACTSDAECFDEAAEWCDVDIGYCKARVDSSDCCTTVGDDSRNDCPPGSSCELLTVVEPPFNVGAAICT